MPPIRTHDTPDNDDDDGMPPLVDNPYPYPYTPAPRSYDVDDDDAMPPLVDPPPYPAPISFTFCNEFDPAPGAYKLAPPAAIRAGPPPPGSIYAADPAEDDPEPEPEARAHGKRRDAAYIPRPPNAFILFRSSFIKSQQVPGRVEGNHSTLSKIIGMYWKTLPPAERARWEDAALVALAEHRARYPDWRFRPGANAAAKARGRVKDGGGGGSGKAKGKKVKAREKDKGGTERDKGGPRRGRADRDKDKKDPSDARRCAHIARLLTEGKSGAALARALEDWEAAGAQAPSGEDEPHPPSSSPAVSPVPSPAQAVADAYRAEAPSPAPVSLTSMYKRAHPAPPPASACLSPIFEGAPLGHWSDPFDCPMPALAPPSPRAHSDTDSAGPATPHLADLPPFTLPTFDFTLDFDFGPGFDFDLAAAPMGGLTNLPAPQVGKGPAGYGAYPQAYASAPQSPGAYSSYSTLAGWAGAGVGVGMDWVGGAVAY